MTMLSASHLPLYVSQRLQLREVAWQTASGKTPAHVLQRGKSIVQLAVAQMRLLEELTPVQAGFCAVTAACHLPHCPAAGFGPVLTE